MENAFVWVQWIAEWLARLVPRWTIVKTTHGWVAWKKGREVTSGGAGIVWWWPAWTEMAVYPIVRQALDLRQQALTTKDGKTVLVGGLITYRIADLEKALAETFDIDETIQDSALTAIHRVVARMTWDELRAAENPEDGKARASSILDKALRKEARRVLSTYGVHVIKMSITDLALAKVYKLATNSTSVALPVSLNDS